MARMAPSWMTISNSLPGGPVKPSTASNRMMWLVDDTGRNAVRPSRRPISAALSVSGIAMRSVLAEAHARRKPAQGLPPQPERLDAGVDVAGVGGVRQGVQPMPDGAGVQRGGVGEQQRLAQAGVEGAVAQACRPRDPATRPAPFHV